MEGINYLLLIRGYIIMAILRYISHLFVTILLFCEPLAALTLNTLYGSYEIDEPVIIELLESRPLQRLKEIDQYGVIRYISDCKTFNRYEHCVGVFILLRHCGASLDEQVAGLLHDASHTVFSHVGDYVFDQPEGSEGSYQDDMHAWFIKNSGLEEILVKHGLPAESIAEYGDYYFALEQPLPELCADRIDYNLRGAYVEGLLSQDEVKAIMQDLNYEDGHWYFNNQKSASAFAAFSLYGTTQIWGAAWNLMVNKWMAITIKQAFKIGLITPLEFQFSSDDQIWQKLLASQDVIIKNNLYNVMHYPECVFMSTPEDANMVLHGKFRGVDPLISTEKGLMRLTSLDPEYRAEFIKTFQLMKAGWNVKVISNNCSLKPIASAFK